MKVDHITFKGDSVIRDTDGIFPETRDFFESCQYGNIDTEIKYTQVIINMTDITNVIYIYNTTIL